MRNAGRREIAETAGHREMGQTSLGSAAGRDRRVATGHQVEVNPFTPTLQRQLREKGSWRGNLKKLGCL